MAAVIKKVGVIGAGQMGSGIAHVAAVMGAQVRLYDALQGAAKGAIERVHKNLAKGVELGKLSAEQRDDAGARPDVRRGVVAETADRAERVGHHAATSSCVPRPRAAVSIAD